jgi:DNA-binding beta-propeller fold protein YncE
VVDLKAGKITSTFSTGGKLRANGMAFNPKDKIVIVANSNDEPAPFLSLVSSEPDHKVVAKIPMPDSAENLERSAYHAPSGMFYTVIPVLKSEKPIGGMAQIDAKSGKLIKLHALEGCHPHSLQIVSDTTIFLGCSSAHGAASKPGGDLGIFDIAAGKIEAMLPGAGGNGSSDSNPKLGQVYHAASHGALRVIDVKSKKLVQDIPTSVGARSVGVTQGNNRVYLATNASGPCGACIMVFAPQ